MSYLVLLFVYRKPGMPTADFQNCLEKDHIPVFYEITGPHAPTEFTRHYVARVDSGAGDRLGVGNVSSKRAEAAAPVVLIGQPEDIPWDVMYELKFRDELHFQHFFALVNDPENAEKLAASEEEFDDPTKLRAVVIGETYTTTWDGKKPTTTKS